MIIAMEIRDKVVEYVEQRIEKLQETNEYLNISVIKTNAMKYLPNFFKKGQVINIENNSLAQKNIFPVS
jgi:tRNA (guanine-N7-)-methyltransferase